MKLPFTKMQGLGNDFIVINDLSRAMSSPLNAEVAMKLCDRRFGVGADQILWLRKPIDLRATARMEILNSDGSIAEMCGNGIRAVAIYLDRYGTEKKPFYHIETLAGMKQVEVKGNQVAVDMGEPGLGAGVAKGGEDLNVQGRTFKFFEVSMGNPHAVFFTDDVKAIDLERLGPAIENDPRFPKRTNVEFVEVTGSDSIQVRVWERGAGITLACGTGACASAVATLVTGRAQGKLQVHLPGGQLQIGWAGPGQPVVMEGPAEEVFQGEVEI